MNSGTDSVLKDKSPKTLGRRGRILVMVAAFVGWMFAGWEMSLVPLASRAMTIGLLQESADDTDWVQRGKSATDDPNDPNAVAKTRLDSEVGKWFTRYIASFLFGAALGGWVFGWCADRHGRARTMALSIVWYAGFTGLSYVVRTPAELCAMRFIACMGIGGMWPCGVSLVSEAWPDVSRPTLAGLIGCSANVGIALLSIVVKQIGELWPAYELTAESWRWMFLLGAVPVIPGVLAYFVIPESPRWLAERDRPVKPASPIAEILRPPLLKFTIGGIALGTIPLLGAWGAQKWILPWAGKVGAQIGQESLKADTQTAWAIGAALGSLCGGWLATLFGRRTTYFGVSLISLVLAKYIFMSLNPEQGWGFLLPVFVLGLISTVYFGWLPLFLPELFPTRVRATGSGVSFNSGRIIAAAVVLSIAGFVDSYDGDYPAIGSFTSWIYVGGMIVILLVPRSAESIDAEPADATTA